VLSLLHTFSPICFFVANQDKSINPMPELDWDVTHQSRQNQQWEDFYSVGRCGNCDTCKRMVGHKLNVKPCSCTGCREKTPGCMYSLCKRAVQDELFCLPEPFPSCWSYKFQFTKKKQQMKNTPVVIDGAGDEMTDAPQLMNTLLLCGYTGVQALACLNCLYNQFGKIMATSQLHPLLKKPWLHDCLDPDGQLERTTGMVIDYRKVRTRIGKEGLDTVFSVQLDDTGKPSSRPFKMAVNHHVQKVDAANGVAAYKNRHNPPATTGKGWVVPDKFRRLTNPVDGSPMITFSQDGFDFVLSRAPSKIQGAGHGLFLTVTNTSAEIMELKLEPGRLIDLGIYGPLSQEDFTEMNDHLTKCFLYNNGPKVYVFQSYCPGYSVDPIDGATGELNEETKKSLLVYANETDGKGTSKPSLHVKYDAHGAIHYLLGHADDRSGPLVIKCNTTIDCLCLLTRFFPG
jgi:hypothetical protein